MKKRILALLLAAIMVVSLLPVTALATGTSYAITNGTPEIAKETNHGYISIDKATAAENATVTVTVTPSEGYRLKSLTVTPGYIVTFNLNGIDGTAPTAQTIEKDGKVTKPTDPTDTIHTFAGWYKTKDATTGALSDPWDFDNGTVTANMTLYAQWTRTLESIYGTNENVPKADNNTAPENAWENGDGGKAFIAYSGKTSEVIYLYKKLEPSGAKQLSCRKTENFTKIGDDYVLDYYLSSSFYGKYTLHMTDGKFTSVTYNGAGTDYEVLSGTYAPANKLLKSPSPKLLKSPAPVDPETITPAKQTDGTYQFTMPGYAVTVTAEFEEVPAPAHTHSFTYTVNGGKLTATCTAGCDKGYDTTPLTLTLTAPTSLVYDGNAKAFTFADGEAAAWTGAGLELPAFEYYLDKPETSWLDGLDGDPIAAAEGYVVMIRVGVKAAQVEFNIDKATPYIKTTPAPNDIEYGDKLSESTLFGGYVQVSSTNTTQVGGLFEWKLGDTIPALSDSETTEYDVTFTPADTNNYNTVSCKVKIKVTHTHNPVKVAGQAATETAAGWSDYYECDCGALFEDENGTTPIENLDTWKASTGNGYLAPLVHTVTPVNGQNATDTEAGYEAYYECKNCGKYYEDATGLIEITNIDEWKAEGGNGYLAPLTPAKYTVTFNMGNHGTQIDPQTVEEGNKATKPSDPTAADYTFGGWFRDAGCTQAWNFDTDTVTANTTLYAKWTKNSSGRSSGTVTTVVNMPLIRTGNRGDSVKELQTKLNALGYNCGAVDGIFGSKTYAAVVAFQKANGIGVDGIVGPEIWGKLDVTGITVTTAPSAVTSAVNLTISSNMPLITKGSTGDAVKALQTKLNALGYDCGKVDGIFGDKTLAAVKAYQTDKALLVDGKVGNQTWGALR